MIRNVRLVNWCQHADRQMEFHPGFNALVGRNGAGKSNLLMALLFGLTGDVTTAGVMADNINDTAESKEPSYVELQLCRNNVPATIRRDLRPVGRRLSIAGKECTAAKDVNQALEAYLGAAGPVLSSYVFVPQWRIFSFLDQRDSERAASFHRLFGTDRLEKVHKALTRVELSTDTSEEALQLLRQEDERLLSELTKAAEHLASLPTPIEHLESTPQSKLLYRATQAEHVRQQLLQLDGRLLMLRSEKQKTTLQLLTEQSHLQSMGPKPTISEDELRQQKKRHHLRKELLHTQQQLIQEGEQDDPPAATSHPDPATRAALAAEAVTLGRFVGTFADGKAACPTCGTLATALQEHIDQSRVRLQEVNEQIARLNAQEKAASLHDQWKLREQRRTHNLQHVRTRLAEQPEPALSEAQLEEATRQLAQQAEWQTRENRCQALQQQLGRLQGQIEETTAAIERGEENLKSVQVDPEEHQKAVLWLEAAKKQQTDYLLATTHQQFVQRSLAANRERMRPLQKQARLAGQDRVIQERFERLAGVFHWNALPRDLAETYLDRAVQGANELLEQFDAGFTVEVGPSLGFLARRRKGKQFAASRLSGGEKVLFSLAFRVRVNSMFAQDVGLLVLDEPTAGVDEVNISCLERAFVKLREMSSSSGLQVIVVTHEQRLAPLFDRVYELSPPVVAGRRKQ